ncbi:MAG: type I methionyl aminopeptidase [Acidimicrobiia bacterium]|nr:type I methionyl aminopeptidase [Acidimicrobiia bacterium]MBT8216472.1 type I methionyl aminopeptidase [Acidimicrobiia bacterium]NNF09749.1 type I methionyl aminopeptidase [Acidimicrobiia bacterium]NNL71427.1 type I methionyl aminopeptidase [Acidimicrobiia bacterium]
MITIKDEAGFERMRTASRTVAEVLGELREAAAPGVSMTDLDAIAARIIRDRGCTPSFLGYHGYPATICASPNNVIVHGIPDGYTLKEGDILSVDVGAIYEGFHGDAARTFAIGEVPDQVSKLIQVTEESMNAGISQVKAGARIGDIGAAVQQVAEGAGFSVVREYVGHGIGEAMHEEPQIPNYGDRGRGMKLKKGMAICIEPMVNVGDWRTEVLDDGWTVVTADGSLSAHFENTIAITTDGVEVMTADG